jgi:hypothetical protein
MTYLAAFFLANLLKFRHCGGHNAAPYVDLTENIEAK